MKPKAEECYTINGSKYLLESEAQKMVAKEIIESLRMVRFNEFKKDSNNETIIGWIANRYGIGAEAIPEEGCSCEEAGCKECGGCTDCEC